MIRIIFLAFYIILTPGFANAVDTATAHLPGFSKKDTASQEKPLALFGYWRGVFKWNNGTEVPFNFEVTGSSYSNARVYFLNGGERFEAGKIIKDKDSLYIALDQFDNELVFGINGEKLTGFLRRQDRSGTPVAVSAEAGKRYRFKEKAGQPAGNISGTYDIVFNPGEKPEKAVGLFKQEGNRLTATFLRITGDSRYLEGYVEGRDFYLSSFIGSSPAYYKGSFDKTNKLNGQVLGARARMDFSGAPNEEAALPDPYSLTYLKEGYTSLDFSFPDLEGKMISPKDAKYKNKVLIITITGTWCPNCIDEASFLAPWYAQNKSRGVEVISIHYERKTDTAFVKKAISRFRNKFDIRYDEVFAGLADKQEVALSLPALNAFLSFPTTIFIDKKGKVAKIHTGYSGPATGKFYDEFVRDFNQEVDSLLKQ